MLNICQYRPDKLFHSVPIRTRALDESRREAKRIAYSVCLPPGIGIICQLAKPPCRAASSPPSPECIALQWTISSVFAILRYLNAFYTRGDRVTESEAHTKFSNTQRRVTSSIYGIISGHRLNWQMELPPRDGKDSTKTIAGSGRSGRTAGGRGRYRCRP